MEKELPKGWVEVVLEDLYSHVTGGDWGLDPQAQDAEGFSKVICIRGGELRNWRVDKGKTASIRLVKDSSINTRRLKIGDILLEISGGGPDQPVGRTVIIDEDVFKNHPELPKVCTNFLRLVRLVDIVNKQYINQYLQYFYSSGEVVKYQGGSNNLRNLKFGDYSSIKIPLPPLPGQQRIVAKLDILFGHLDALKTSLDRIPQLLKDFRQKVLTQAVTGKLTEEWREVRELEEIDNAFGCETDFDLHEIPESWIYSKIGLIGDVKGGKRLPLGDELIAEVTAHPYIRARDLKQGTVLTDNLMYISEETHKKIQRYIVKEGDVYITIVGAKIGDAGVIPMEMNGANLTENAAKITNYKNIEGDYLSIWLRSPICQDYILKSIMSAAQGKLALTRINELPVYLTVIEEQQEIVHRVESLFAKADQIDASYQKLKAKIVQLPQALLAKAFRGELVAQVPTDGDARDLLEQIKQAKAGLEKGGRSKRLKSVDEVRMVADDGARYGKK